MVPNALGSVSLGYKLLWNRQRQVCGVQLFLGTHDPAPVDARHLLSTPSPHLLTDLLDHAPVNGPWLEVHASQLQDPALCIRVHQAHRRGLQLIWRGEPGARPSADMAPCFLRAVMPLTAGEALAGWPVEDVLHGYRHQRIQPEQRAISRLTQAIEPTSRWNWWSKFSRKSPYWPTAFCALPIQPGWGCPATSTPCVTH